MKPKLPIDATVPNVERGVLIKKTIHFNKRF